MKMRGTLALRRMCGTFHNLCSMYAPSDKADRVHWVEKIKGRTGDGSVGAGDLGGIKKGEVVRSRTCSVDRVHAMRLQAKMCVDYEREMSAPPMFVFGTKVETKR